MQTETLKHGRDYTDAELDELGVSVERARQILQDRREIKISPCFLRRVVGKAKLKFSRPCGAGRIYRFRNIEAAFDATFKTEQKHSADFCAQHGRNRE